MQRLICQAEALDRADPAAAKELRSAEYLLNALNTLSIERTAWAELLENEPDGALH